jgi:DinB family protein
MDEAYSRLRERIDGLTDDEFFWQPRPNSWTIYEDRPGHWTYHYEIPDPVPAPLTTIGWQVVHIATCKLMYHEWAFGPAKMTFPDIEIPNTAAGAIGLLEQGHELIRHDLDKETESGLGEERLTNWGERWPAWRIFTAMTDHDALHAGTIGYLRDLYYWTR